MREIYERQGTWREYPEMLDFVRSRGWTGLQNGLDEPENRLLTTTPAPETIIELLLTGLRRRLPSSPPPSA